MKVEQRLGDEPDLVALVTAQQAELRAAERDSEAIDGSFPLHDDIRYLVVVVDDEVVACGALQAIDEQAVEIKRMYVRPERRGDGYGRTMLAVLEERAAADGFAIARLETGSYLPAALGLYRNAGYRPIPTYGEYVTNPFSRCFEKALKAPAPA
ncbi:GNAT family N-acetyltransferase [Asanoa sp. NPDC050611]|uniref:GNAT family N-acetyltransferase n=1 Tax=Asanoa sp. NPDC050611 TaxID=3157098 RepID=UPI0033DE2E06